MKLRYESEVGHGQHFFESSQDAAFHEALMSKDSDVLRKLFAKHLTYVDHDEQDQIFRMSSLPGFAESLVKCWPDLVKLYAASLK